MCVRLFGLPLADTDSQTDGIWEHTVGTNSKNPEVNTPPSWPKGQSRGPLGARALLAPSCPQTLAGVEPPLGRSTQRSRSERRSWGTAPQCKPRKRGSLRGPRAAAQEAHALGGSIFLGRRTGRGGPGETGAGRSPEVQRAERGALWICMGAAWAPGRPLSCVPGARSSPAGALRGGAPRTGPLAPPGAGPEAELLPTEEGKSRT